MIGKPVESMGDLRMNVTVKLFASLRKGRFADRVFYSETTLTVREVLASLEIPEEDVSIVFINGRHKDLAAAIEDGDMLAFFPPVGGG